jgi:hypothetical protein
MVLTRFNPVRSPPEKEPKAGIHIRTLLRRESFVNIAIKILVGGIFSTTNYADFLHFYKKYCSCGPTSTFHIRYLFSFVKFKNVATLISQLVN